jgi:signal transduction histidine kinase/GAF domain-containing protein
MSVANTIVALPEWLQDLTGQGIVITDTALVIRGWNHWLEVHSGRRAADVLGQHLLDVYPELVARRFDQSYQQALDGQVIVLAQRLHRYLLPMPAPDDFGEFQHMQQSARIGPLIDGGQVVGTATVIDDVTERVAREDELSRLLAQEQAARGQLAFMAEASAHLAVSLDYETTLQHVARLMLPDLADYCLIDIVADDRQIQRVASAHIDPARETLLHELERRYPDSDHGGQPAQIAIQTGRSAILPDVANALSSDRAYAPEHQQMLSTLATRSVLAVPLLTRGQILGAITLCSTQTDRYDAQDQVLIEALAHRAAMAIDNARLYRQAQAALRARDHALAIVEAERSKLQRLFMQAPAAICILEGPEHRFAFANSLYRRIVGDRDLIGKSVPEALPELMGQGFLALLDRVYSTGEPFIGSELPAQIDKSGDGSLVSNFFNFVYQPTRDAQGNVDGILVHAIDVTDQVRAQRERTELFAQAEIARAEAERAVQIRDQFFSVAAHELKTPLTSLLGNVQLIQRRSMREGLLQERDQRALGVVAAQTHRLHQMIEALLDVTRLESGHLSLNRAPLDLGALVQRIVDEVQPTLSKHTLAFASRGPALLVDGDALRLEQVLQNIVQNAIKYSPGGGAIAIDLRSRDGSACVSVTDQGIGIPQDSLQRLFSRFYRAKNVDDQQISGMGIGLYVVKEIVTLHGGSVAVESSEGIGSTFTICLPLIV